MRKEKPADTTLKPSPDWMKNNSAPLAGDEIAGTMIYTIHNNTESEIVNIIEPKKWTKTQTSSLSDQYCTAMKNTNIRRAQNVVFEPWCLSNRLRGVLMMFHLGFMMVCMMVLRRRKMSKKYHESHPTISFRCLSIDEYNTIKKMVGISRKSESDFVREVVLGAVEKESQSYTNGWYRGINHIAWLCPVCGELKAFPITHIFEEQSLVNLLAQSFEKTAYHPECLQKKKRQEKMRR